MIVLIKKCKCLSYCKLNLTHSSNYVSIMRFIISLWLTYGALPAAYYYYISGAELFTEIADSQMLLKSRGDPLPTTPLDLFSFIVSYGDDVFPNLRIALQILHIIAVSITSCERFFSKLKLILSYLRVSMGQQRLVDLAFLIVLKEKLLYQQTLTT